MRAGLAMLTWICLLCRKAARSKPQLPVASMQACMGASGVRRWREPDKERLKAGLRVGKAAVAHALADQQGCVELGFVRRTSRFDADVKAEAVPEASEPVAWTRPCRPPCDQAFRPAGALDTVQSRDGQCAPGPGLRDEHKAQGKDKLTGAVSAMAIADTNPTYKGSTAKRHPGPEARLNRVTPNVPGKQQRAVRIRLRAILFQGVVSAGARTPDMARRTSQKLRH